MPILLFSNNCYYQLSGTAEIAELAEVDPLPSAKVQAAIGDGDGDADTAQRRFGVGRHIVSTLQRMLILRTILRHETVENRFHIHTNIRVTVLVDAQSATGMLREDVHNASPPDESRDVSASGLFQFAVPYIVTRFNFC